MNKRSWDPDGKYKDGNLRSYKNWTLELSFRQHTLGCFIIFSNRDIEKISELSNDELCELKDIMSEMESALLSLDNFKPDRFNYLQLGNALNRLHFHGIPRYKSQRNFNGEIWIDKAWGHPPVWSTVDISSKLINELKKIILKEFA